ncbi:hypothetical protein SLS55_007624 [Diplodia seriata]|uniref:Ornithine aminotransferase n=1 Tax=Diplodia seriata TaxID=420778 RepID=A0ABR3C9G4_9PEZI
MLSLYARGKLCEMTGFDKVAAMNGGAEAVDMAIKFARSWAYKVKGVEQNKALVLTAESEYHGRTLSVPSASSKERYRKIRLPRIQSSASACRAQNNCVRSADLVYRLWSLDAQHRSLLHR